MNKQEETKGFIPNQTTFTSGIKENIFLKTQENAAEDIQEVFDNYFFNETFMTKQQIDEVVEIVKGMIILNPNHGETFYNQALHEVITRLSTQHYDQN